MPVGDIRKTTVNHHPILDFLYKDWFKIVIALIAIYGFYYLNNKTDKNTEAIQDSLVQQKMFQDGSIMARGNVEKQLELEKIARDKLSNEIRDQIRTEHGTVVAVISALGQINASITAFGKITGEKKSDGSFLTTVAQDRGKDKAPLTSVVLKYDATKSNLTEALSGSSWRNNVEEYKLTYGEWRTEKQGLRSSASLKRTIYSDDNKTQKLGEENIPLTNADAFYSIDNILNLSPLPKYTFITGTIHDFRTGKNGIIGIFDTKLTRKIGISTGVAFVNGEKNIILGGSITFGKLKNN